MRTIEMKFLFEGVIFSSQVFIDYISDSLNKCEFTIKFFNPYLICKYSECYFFILENHKFKPIYIKDEKEYELVKTLQDAIREVYSTIKKKVFILEECCH